MGCYFVLDEVKRFLDFRLGYRLLPLSKGPQNLAVANTSPFPLKPLCFLGRKPFLLENVGLLLSNKDTESILGWRLKGGFLEEITFSPAAPLT